MSLFKTDEKMAKDLKEVEVKVRNSFAAIKEEMEDHLEAINENTNEIQANYEYLCELDNKMEKLNEKIENLTMTIREMMAGSPRGKFSLTFDEQKVFIVLYALGEEKGPLSALDIAIRMNSTELLVKTCIKNIMQKNVPINEKVIDGAIYFELERSFKELQAKENILNLDETLIREMSR